MKKPALRRSRPYRASEVMMHAGSVPGKGATGQITTTAYPPGGRAILTISQRKTARGG